MTCNKLKKHNRETIFSSIIHGGGLQEEYDILLTFDNQNRFTVEISDVKMRMYYQKDMIGYWYPPSNQSWKAPAGTLNDMLAKVTMTPPISEAYTIYEKYYNNSLNLEIEFEAYGRASIMGIGIGMDIVVTYPNYLIGATLPEDRTKCKCPSDF